MQKLPVNTYITLSSQELEDLFYSKNPYKHDGLYLTQHHPIDDETTSEGPYLVCFFENMTLLDILQSFRKYFPNYETTYSTNNFAKFESYDREDGGLLHFFVPPKTMKFAGRYTSFFDGKSKPRKNFGVHLDYINYLLERDIPRSEWQMKKTKLGYLKMIGDSYYPSVYNLCIPFEVLYPENETMILEDFDPDLIV